jgi:hypothetical protein
MDTMNVGSSFSQAHVNQEIGKEEEFDMLMRRGRG